ncbi:unnamed protein product [Paramecium pentaurelia]|uniref:RING-type domain-containing protein n=1 Tax=Paramecium pentaurelia TaxID=43138 RepID=A0A8S1S7X9_9CILI|nr:unnamed protein product [Paramecium pentaurelia]
MVFAYLKKRCIEYQYNPNLKKHIAINLILIVLTIIIRTLFEIYLRQQLTSLNEFNQIQSEKQSQENNEIQINNPTLQKQNNHLKLSYMILDQLLHLMLSLEIIALIFQITLIINKEKQELPILDPLLKEQKDMSCSLQFVKSSNYGISSIQNNQPTYNSIEMLTLSRNKGTPNQIKNQFEERSPLNVKQYQLEKNVNLQKQEIPYIQEENNTHSNIQIQSDNQILEIPSNKSIQNIPSNKKINQVEQSNTKNQTQQIIYSKILGRAQKCINGNYQNIYIIQKCEKQENCNFFWISQIKSTNYFCLNCDQKNIIVQNNEQFEIKNNQNIKINKFFQSNKFEQQLDEMIQIYKDTQLKFCHSFQFCGFFWIKNKQDNQNEYYCPICQETYITQNGENKETIYKDIISQCSYCCVNTSQYFQATCFHTYHFECLKELGKNQMQTKILCIICNMNMMSCLKRNKMLPQETFEKIFTNQIQRIREETMHEGVEDLE